MHTVNFKMQKIRCGLRSVRTKMHAKYITQETKNMKNKLTQQNASFKNATKLNSKCKRINLI